MSSVIRPGSGKPAIRRGYGPDEGDSGVQRIRTGVVNVTPGDDFELIARQTSASVEVVE